MSPFLIGSQSGPEGGPPSAQGGRGEMKEVRQIVCCRAVICRPLIVNRAPISELFMRINSTSGDTSTNAVACNPLLDSGVAVPSH